MVCQYSRPGPMSSEKRAAGPAIGGEGRARDTGAVGGAPLMVGGWCPLPAPLAVITPAAKSPKAEGVRTPARRCWGDPLLVRLTHPFEPLPPARGGRIEAEDPAAGPRPRTRQGDVTAADQPPIGTGVVGGATRPGGDDGGASPGGAGDGAE
jgi:hypothetical protein